MGASARHPGLHAPHRKSVASEVFASGSRGFGGWLQSGGMRYPNGGACLTAVEGADGSGDDSKLPRCSWSACGRRGSRGRYGSRRSPRTPGVRTAPPATRSPVHPARPGPPEAVGPTPQRRRPVHPGGQRSTGGPASPTLTHRTVSMPSLITVLRPPATGALREGGRRPPRAVRYGPLVRLPRGVPRPDRGRLHRALHRHFPGRSLTATGFGRARPSLLL